MFEEDSYEQLAELYIKLNGNSLNDFLYCICSRIILRAAVTDEENLAEHCIDSGVNEGENTIRFLNSSTESQPSTVHRKKDHDDGVSCYCSASHCSTDDSTRDALCSDSGADLSETSRDPDWEDYWSKHGESIIWESWIERYGEYIDPAYLKDRQTSSGNIENLTDIIHEHSDVTRLSYSSEVSDSLTNVTPLTLSELSTEESSLMSSSDSAGSVSTDVSQWQALWIDHFNAQYQLAYERYKLSINVLEDNQKEEIKNTKSNSRLKSHTSRKTRHKRNLDFSNRNFDLPSEDVDLSTRNLDSSSNNLDFSCVGSIVNHLRSITMAQDDPLSENVLNEKDIQNLKEECGDESSSNTNLHNNVLKEQNALSIDDMDPQENIEIDHRDGNMSSEPKEETSHPILSEGVDKKLQDNCAYSTSDPEAQTRFKLKRPHEREDDRLRSAFNLFGLSYSGEGITSGSVYYKKKNIRWQNRLLNMNTHIHFDEDGHVINKDKKTEKIIDNNETWFVASTCEIKSDFSEKDDSSGGEFYSASEEGDAKKEKRKKKKKRKGLPKEILENEKLLKFWYQRYRLFSKFDEGIKLDEESWYSVSPEKVSRHTAERCRCDVIIDACCGAGGNTIQFAFTCERVIAIDIDPQKIELARHNARIYGVEDRIEFIVGDFTKLAPGLQADVVFLSPPWGGLGYNNQLSYSLNKILPPLGGSSLFEISSRITPNIAMYLPRNINSDELLQLVGPDGSLELEQNFLGRKLIAVTAYFGDLVGSYSKM